MLMQKLCQHFVVYIKQVFSLFLLHLHSDFITAVMHRRHPVQKKIQRCQYYLSPWMNLDSKPAGRCCAGGGVYEMFMINRSGCGSSKCLQKCHSRVAREHYRPQHIRYMLQRGEQCNLS